MDQNTKDVLIAVIPASIALAGTLFVTWRTNAATRRHTISLKWWELKAKTYTDIIRALADLEFVLGEWETHFVEGTSYSQDYKNKLARVRRKAEQNLKILGGTDPFLITAEAAKAIRKTSGVMDLDFGTGDVVAEIQTQLTALKECRDEMSVIAKQDLRE